ncbi:MAG: zinc-binding alcohol dehydrogenase [Armatimonadota bacterium]|nr:zinc-binding alcohol dehydrogenase [Armatimonadota bacterium]MDR7475757.1 zinc-binding alcohol dehydrogenase [Armatimonadota bacterium]
MRIRAVCSAISHGTEMLIYRGEAPAGLRLDLPTLRGSFGFPVKYGYASVGRVTEVGSGVQTPSPGDLVFTHHPHQTVYTVPAGMPVVLPQGLPPEAGVFLANLETAVNALLDAPVLVGEVVVIFGQGVVGLLLTQLVRRHLPAVLLAVEPVAHRRALSLVLGADAALDPREDIPSAVAARSEGRGADLVLEASGQPAALQAAMDIAGVEGRIVVVSWYGTKSVEVDLGSAFHRRRLRVISSQVGDLPGALSPRWDLLRRRRVATRLLPALTLAPLVTHRIPFDRAAEAYALVDAHAGQVVQVVLTYDDV